MAGGVGGCQGPFVDEGCHVVVDARREVVGEQGVRGDERLAGADGRDDAPDRASRQVRRILAGL
ncbi:hypothetical protein [Streptomyces sp. NPDC087270]|uniref:hypothetical protein n=1 Tax=Streptomyces sp. NPDC087270 TaxID=3365774 RepID=UPI00380D34EF